jgi:hypothetical protein
LKIPTSAAKKLQVFELNDVAREYRRIQRPNDVARLEVVEETVNLSGLRSIAENLRSKSNKRCRNEKVQVSIPVVFHIQEKES